MATSSPMLVFLSVLLTLTSTLPKCSANFARKNESSGHSGRQTAPIEAIACSGTFCDNKRHVALREGTAASVHNSAIWTPFSRLGKTVTRTPTFSEERSGYSGRQTTPIAGISCSDRYCDNKRLVIVRDGASTPVIHTGHWTRFFSEERPSSADCPSDMVVNEMQCSERYCDKIRLQCGRLGSDYRVDTSDIKTVNWFSEEEGERLCPDGYYVWGVACRGRYCDSLRLKCARVDYKAGPPTEKDFVADSVQFSPIYFFDRKASENCLPDWPSSANNFKCRTTLNPSTPVFVKYDICDSFEVYTFWVWYGLQKSCNIVFDPGHGDDGEKVSVFVRDGQVQKVTYYQHRGRYTRRRGTFDKSGERPHVYVGKISHGSYHARCDGVCGLPDLIKGCLGSVNYCQGGCGYWDDFRNPGSRLHTYTVYDLQPGATIDGLRRPNINPCVSSCEGAKTRDLRTAGCWQNNV